MIGHQDATPKARCPGPHFNWPEVEGKDGALAPDTDDVDDETLSRLFGGYFSGDEGENRVLKFGDRDERRAEGSFALKRDNKVIADALTAGPVSFVETALGELGYGVNEPILRPGKKTNKGNVIRKEKPPHRHQAGHLDEVLTFCLAQFIRRFASGDERQELVFKSKQPNALNEANLAIQVPRVHLNLDLAKLLVRAQLVSQRGP